MRSSTSRGPVSPPSVAAPPTAAEPPAPRRTVERDTSMEAAAQQAGVLAQASREVSDTSAEAAASLAELRAAIGDISSSTGRASAIAEGAVGDARAVDERIAALQTASAAITGFVRLISAISQQSRFLALNASVEAARAGDLGRGFAVVADEVKELADRTAQAARDIDAQITAVQQETRQAVEVVQRITGTLGAITQAQDAIAAAVAQQRVATDRVVANVDRAAGGSARITEAVARLAESQRVVYVRRALAVAEQQLADLGGARLGAGRSTLPVRDQSTGATHTARLPDLLIGERVLDRSDDPRRPAVLVDEVVRQVGGSCTVFQRLDDGGMVRVATSVLTPAGRRNVGTCISRTDGGGSPNPVLAAVLAGTTYTGAATVADRPYFTAYTGLHDDAGALIGMLYVGLPLDTMPGSGR